MKMKPQFWLRILPITVFCVTWLIACKDDDKPKLLPEVTTSPVTDVTTTTAMGGGEIVSDGNDKITTSGICWSNTNTTPTTADSKTELTTSEGSFTSKMENLPSGSTIYVRAYATNSIDTGYGESVTFVTGNAAPVAINVTIAGQAEVNKKLTGTYTYTDAEINAESGTTVQWYRATDGSGTGEIAISGGTTSSYTPQDIDEFKFIRFGVTPKSVVGNTTGTETKSSFVGPVAVRTTVTFTYNGAEVTYAIITSSLTGRKWLDRNLGAPNTPTAYNDYVNYGDLFQWGRGSDGHQLVIRDASKTYTPVNGITTTLSSGDTPGHNQFISAVAIPRDWRSPQNDNLWQISSGVNNPCPTSWHIPTDTEWDAENLNDIVAAYSQLKLNYAGPGRFRDGALVGSPYYWSSSKTVLSSGTIVSIAYDFEVGGIANPKTSSNRANAYVCRCIMNN